jgi:hypothetical protein
MMKGKTLGFLVLADLAVTATWLVLMIAMFATYGTLDSFEQALAFATERHWLFYTVNYGNALLLTIINTMVFAGLYAFLRRDVPGWAEIGFAFVPIYAIIALGSYLSQIVVLPRLIDLLALPEYQAATTVLLRHPIQIWPESSLQQLDQFSYFLGSIPSLIFAVGLIRRGRPRVAVWLLGLSGFSWLFIGVGVVAGWTQLVSVTSMLGGILAIVAWVFLAMGLLRGAPERTALQTGSAVASGQ